MTGSIYFGSIQVSGASEHTSYATNKEELEKNLMEEWKQETRNVLKFIQDSKLNMPLMEQVLASSVATISIQEYVEQKPVTEVA